MIIKLPVILIALGNCTTAFVEPMQRIRRDHHHQRTSLSDDLPSTLKSVKVCNSNSNTAVIRTLDNVERVFAISDLHTDKRKNMEWLIENCALASLTEDGYGADGRPVPTAKDALIIAGDISHNMTILERTLSTVKNTLGCEIIFVSGNHEAWLDDDSSYETSLDKLEAVDQLCTSLGVHTDVCMVGSAHRSPAYLLPMKSWYDGSLTLENTQDLCQNFRNWPWTDFSLCKWPQYYYLNNARTEQHPNMPQEALVKDLLQQNERGIEAIRRNLLSTNDATSASAAAAVGLISISHFLPNQQSLPDWVDVESKNFLRNEWLNHPAPDTSAKFAKVAGSQLIDDQIRSIVEHNSNNILKYQIHVFGHSHRPKDFMYENIRYVHNPLGSPLERTNGMVSRKLNFQCIWDTRKKRGIVPGKRVVRHWEECNTSKLLFLRSLVLKRRRRRRRTKFTAETIVDTRQ